MLIIAFTCSRNSFCTFTLAAPERVLLDFMQCLNRGGEGSKIEMEKGFIIAETISIPHLCPRQFQRGVSNFVTSLWLQPPLWSHFGSGPAFVLVPAFRLCVCEMLVHFFFYLGGFFSPLSSKHSWEREVGIRWCSAGGSTELAFVVWVLSRMWLGSANKTVTVAVIMILYLNLTFTVIVFNDCYSG